MTRACYCKVAHYSYRRSQGRPHLSFDSVSLLIALRSVLVTGCSAGGIGAALCKEFQKHGLHVFATVRTPSKVGDIAKLPNVTVVALDVTSPSSLAAAGEMVKAQTGGSLDYLANYSGSHYVTLDMDIEEAKKTYDVNV